MKMKFIILATLIMFMFVTNISTTYAITIGKVVDEFGNELTLIQTTDGSMAFSKEQKMNIDNLKNHTVIVMRQEVDGQYRGAGIVIDKRHILTVNHVISKIGKNFYFANENADPLWATVVKQDAAHDLALLEIDKNAPDLIADPIPFAKEISVGEKVYTIGHPKDKLLYSLTYGKVRRLDSKGSDNIPCIELDIRIIGGNSGGFVINAKGEIVGMMFSSLEQVGNMAFMICLDDIKNFLNKN